MALSALGIITFTITTLCIKRMTFSVKSLSMIMYSITTLGITKLYLMKLSITNLSKKTF
jgi:hypothetical protein